VPKSRGWTVAKQAVRKKPWVKPELRRIGDIKQVAGKQTPSAQASASKS